MKKYLMIGLAALAFASCAKHDFETMTQEQIDKAKYDQVFIQTFGQPDPNHTWGFGSTTRALTRTYNVQGNLWHDPDYFNLEYDAPVTNAEKNLVFNYVNNKNSVETVDQISFSKYWVAQIWNGEDDANAEGVKAPTSTSYRKQDGTTATIVGGAQMDKLEIKENANTWTHCNNFNSADNTNYKEGGEGGRTLMIESGTLSFRYTNSHSSYLSEKYIIVPGSKIDDSLKDFYYVCFDYERHYTDADRAAEKSYGTCSKWVPQEGNPNGGYWQNNENWELDGFYDDASSAELKAAIKAKYNFEDVDNITFKGYLNGKDFCDGDDNYTDWIVRISPAKVKETPIDYELRIMAEDLTVATNSDLDFNDVVFDAKIDTDANKTYIKVLAAGGTLPLRIGCDENGNGGVEVHGLFGVGTGTMVNTINPDYDTAGETYTFDVAYSSYADIPIYVQKSGVWEEITAHRGDPTSKFGCPVGTEWQVEFTNINEKYDGFNAWVSDETKPFWVEW